jgi:hypothetical protein
MTKRGGGRVLRFFEEPKKEGFRTARTPFGMRGHFFLKEQRGRLADWPGYDVSCPYEEEPQECWQV